MFNNNVTKFTSVLNARTCTSCTKSSHFALQNHHWTAWILSLLIIIKRSAITVSVKHFCIKYIARYTGLLYALNILFILSMEKYNKI